MKKVITTLAMTAALFLNAQTVCLDNTFGTNGISILSHQTNGNSIINSLVLPDGKVTVTGTRINGANNNEVFVSRFNADGSLDTSFANAGFFTVFQEAYAYSTNLFQIDNKILIFYPAQGTLVKLNSDGTADNTFGTNGIVTLSSSSYSGTNVVLGNDLYSVRNVSSQIFLDRIDVNTGLVTSSVPVSGITSSNGIYQGPNNKFIIKSYDSQNFSHSITLVNPDGSVDTTFGSNGSVVVSSFSSLSEFESTYDYVAMDDANNIIYGISNESIPDVTIKKYTSTGSLITGFANNGSYVLSEAVLSGLKTDEGRIYFSGASTQGGEINLLLGRLNQDGSTDNSFNNNGIFIFNTNADQEWAESFHIISPTSILVAGEIDNTNNSIYIGKFIVSPDLLVNETSGNNFYIENPVRSHFKFFSNSVISYIELYSIDGKLIRTIRNNYQDISDMKKGNYIAKIYFKDGKNIIRKLIKS